MPYSWLDAVLDVLLSPALWLSLLLGLVYSLFFTVWRGGGWRQAPKDLLAGWVGFGIGQWVSGLVHLNVLQVGEIRLLGATLGAVIALLAGRLLMRRLTHLARPVGASLKRGPSAATMKARTKD